MFNAMPSPEPMVSQLTGTHMQCSDFEIRVKCDVKPPSHFMRNWQESRRDAISKKIPLNSNCVQNFWSHSDDLHYNIRVDSSDDIHYKHSCRFFRPSRMFCKCSKHSDCVWGRGQFEWHSKCFLTSIWIAEVYSNCNLNFRGEF